MRVGSRLFGRSRWWRQRHGADAALGPTMGRLEVRFAVHRERLRLAAMLDELAPAEWEQASLWPGWSVREVVGHLVLGPQTTYARILIELMRARGDLRRVTRETARRKAAAPTTVLVAELRTAADSDRRVPSTSSRDPLAGILVHGQDIAVPLHRSLPMPLTEAAVAASRMCHSRFYTSRKWTHGLRLEATDIAWARGEGQLIQGPIGPIVLALAGRRAALPRLTGPGVAVLDGRLGPPPL